MAFFPSSSGWFHILMFLLLSVFSLFLLKQRKKGKDGAKLPPSPPRLPIIGNLHQLGKFPHNSFWKLSQKYGPLMLLHLGSIPTLVVSSAEMAEEVLKTHDLDCCSRPHLPGPKKLSYSYLDVAFSPYSNFWKEMRKIFVSELLSAKGVPSLCNAREEEVNRMISCISEAIPNPVNLNEVIFALTDGIIGTFAFGKSYGGKQFDNQKFRLVLDEAMNMLDSFSAEDFFPLVGRIVDALRGLGARLNKSFRGLDGYFEMVFDERLDPAARPKPVPEDLVDVLVGLWKERSGDLHMTKDNVKALLMNVFLGGIDTSAITIEWAMSELVKKPRVLNKVQAEIRSCVGSKPKVDEDDIINLKYLNMVVKETLRLHPPAPLLIPHETIRQFKIGGNGGFDIYPKTRLLVNAWAIGRDPNSWKNPDEFYPERFQSNDIDFKGQDFQLLPFGAGRRICPALNVAAMTVELTLANLLYCFDWELPAGMKREDISMEGEGGITIHKKTPLCLVPIKYNWRDTE